MKPIYTIFVLVFFVACTDDAFFNAGPTVTNEIALPGFDVIEAQNMYELELVNDTVNKIQITCGKNLQSHLDVKVVDNILYLNHDVKNTWSRKYEKIKLKLYSRPFSRINVRQPVKIFNKDIYKGPAFTLVDWGKFSEVDMNVDVEYCLIAMSSDNFGNFKVKGKAATATFWGWGSCLVRADSLITNNCTVLHRGMGNVYVHAVDQLNVSIEFSGNIYYTGNPSNLVIDNHTGSGMLVKK